MAQGTRLGMLRKWPVTAVVRGEFWARRRCFLGLSKSAAARWIATGRTYVYRQSRYPLAA